MTTLNENDTIVEAAQLIKTYGGKWFMEKMRASHGNQAAQLEFALQSPGQGAKVPRICQEYNER